ncbi:MAG: hypothetical protein ACYCTV_00380 [Leptospirales bacterium]
MATGPVINSSEPPRKPEDILKDLKEGWDQSSPAARKVLLWGLGLNVTIQEILARMRNNSRLQQAYREMGEFLYAKRDQIRLDEADHVELDLLQGKILELQEIHDRLSDNAPESGRK